MKEELLHYIWNYKLFYKSELRTTSGEELQIISVGTHNLNTGSDFFNANIRIANQLWAGNVEIHINSSDWYAHSHENDSNYDNVILHVVWNHDTAVFNSENVEIPTLELKGFVSKELLNSYQQLFSRPKKWINCENDIASVDAFIVNNWLERIFFERLEQKSLLVSKVLEETKYNWEEVVFRLLSKNFGLKINAVAFFEMADGLNFSVIRKVSQSQFGVEALFYGQLGMLIGQSEERYFNDLKKEYAYLCKKFKLSKQVILKAEFFRLRPSNFPTIRISQLASLIHSRPNFFTELMSFNKMKQFYEFFDIGTSEFWKTHYTFDKESKKSSKKLTKSFIDLLVINTILPVKFMYLKHLGKSDFSKILALIKELKPEKNGIIDRFKTLKIPVNNAFDSQALLELKNNYCAKQKCLQCAIGNDLIRN